MQRIAKQAFDKNVATHRGESNRTDGFLIFDDVTEGSGNVSRVVVSLIDAIKRKLFDVVMLEVNIK